LRQWEDGQPKEREGFLLGRDVDRGGLAMPESVTPEPRSGDEEVRQMLHAVAQLLRTSPALGMEAQKLLAELIDELGRLLEATPAPSGEMRHLSESVAHLVHAAQEPLHHGLLTSARDRLDKAIVAAEVEAPLAVGLARRLMDALSEIGI
jgi:hypothetical protein